MDILIQVMTQLLYQIAMTFIALQRHYRYLEALALGQDTDLDEVGDQISMNKNKIFTHKYYRTVFCRRKSSRTSS